MTDRGRMAVMSIAEAWPAAGRPFTVWVVDPCVKKPSLTVFELASGCCRQAAQVSGGEAYRAERPFPVEVVPSTLVAGLITE
jgi:hypothetical protein